MKKTSFIAGIMAVLMIILVSGVSQAYAAAHLIVTIQYTQKANVWQLDTSAAFPSFSGRDVDPDTIQVTIWHYCQNTPGLHAHTPEPKQVALADKSLILIFDKSTLPKSAEYTVVTGMLTNGDSFSATGPSFVVCFIGC